MGVHDALRSSYVALHEALSDNRLLEYKWFAEQEADTWKHWVEMPLRRRLWLWRRGFTSPCGALYDLDAHGPDAYVSELQRYRLYRSLNGGHRYLLDDKLSQHWMLSEHPENRPTAYGFVDRGYVHGLAGTEFDGDPVPVAEWLPGALRDQGQFVLKQLRGHGGNEVVVCEYADGEFRLDGTPTTRAALCERVAELSGSLVTEYVHQHEYADELYPHATNTVRVLTLWDDEARELVTAFALHRVGTERSRPIDNYSAGGLTAEIDLETGTLGRAARKPFAGEVPWHDSHPDTGTRIAGTRVPHWEAVRATVEHLARENTNVPAIGWDVVLDESAEPVVLEANTGTHLDLFQVHRPLLADDRVARVAARHLPGVEAPPGEPRPGDGEPRATTARAPPRR